MPKGDKPDFTLWVANDHGKGKAGAAWRNEDGSIGLVLDVWVVLRGRGHAGAQTTIVLYPTSGRGSFEERKKKAAAEEGGEAEELQDDIPF